MAGKLGPKSTRGRGQTLAFGKSRARSRRRAAGGAGRHEAERRVWILLGFRVPCATMSSPSPLSGRPLEAFRTHLEAVRAEVDARLAAVWNETLDTLRPHGDDVVKMGAAARDLTMRGGKRFRPAMLA